MITDKHFVMLMDLMYEQKLFQRKQGQEITKLRQDFLTMQQELALCKLNNENNKSSEIRITVLENKTEKLQKEFESSSKYVNSMIMDFPIKYTNQRN